MSVLGEFFYLLLNAFRIYTVYRFFDLLLSREENQRRVCLYIGYFLASSFSGLFFRLAGLNLIVNMAGLILIAVYGYKGRLQKKMLAVILNVGVGIAAENLAWIIFVKEKEMPVESYGMFFSVFIFFALEVFIDKTVEYRRGIEISVYRNILLIFIIIGSIFIASILIENTYISIAYPIISLCILLAINCSVFYLYETIMDDYRNHKENEMASLQLAMYQKQLKIMKNANETYQTLRHDIRHHIRMVSDYIEKAEYEKALEYLNKVNYHVDNHSRYVDTGNESIDSVLNYMTDEIHKIGGTVSTDIEITRGLQIDDFDMNVILSNLLLNAYEAIGKSEKKEIHIMIKYNRGILGIGIRNTYNGIYKEKDGEMLSTKENPENHGIGLLSVKKAVHKYNGGITINHTNDIFCVNLFLYLYQQ